MTCKDYNKFVFNSFYLYHRINSKSERHILLSNLCEDFLKYLDKSNILLWPQTPFTLKILLNLKRTQFDDFV